MVEFISQHYFSPLSVAFFDSLCSSAKAAMIAKLQAKSVPRIQAKYHMRYAP
ncbi:conserved hypothetical protein [Xenorhabdus bovienii str. Jollieti]|uniref:Uncharacterized protein n=2 Tax=Xenorhabdus bovienii TaxID=40576 RepID=A0A077QJ15_XENBV|nr:conserved hypothetical protein [Xenorhabdus bovienii SS-2004]CDH29902.1 conserved hypothetical protein [Xenorhabdus bovienii str. Jollieti]CDH33564.1 conserved hypothetical protein [Xenorhabdus bovienii str. Intermedium]